MGRARGERIRVELTPRQVEEIRDIVDSTGLPRRDVFTGALLLLKWAAREIQEGRQIASVEGDRVREFLMPLLETLRNP